MERVVLIHPCLVRCVVSTFFNEFALVWAETLVVSYHLLTISFLLCFVHYLSLLSLLLIRTSINGIYKLACAYCQQNQTQI